MLGKVWACVASVICGVLITDLAGGPLPIANTLVIASVLAGLTITLIALLKARNAVHEPDDIPASTAAVAAAGEIVDQVTMTIGGRPIEWLREERFVDPWRDDHVIPFRELVELVPAPESIVGPNASLIRDLINATRSFHAAYAQTTIRDPMVADSTWRIIGLPASFDGTGALDDEHEREFRARLKATAASICEHYDAVTAASRTHAGVL